MPSTSTGPVPDDALDDFVDDAAPSASLPVEEETAPGASFLADDVEGRFGTGEDTLRLYLAPDGDDTRTGLSPDTAIKTLVRAQQRIVAIAPVSDVEILVAAGTYPAQRVEWTTVIAGRSIIIRAEDLDGARPVFDGCATATQCEGGTWFELKSTSGAPSRIALRHLRVERYQTAISFNGNRGNVDQWNGKNTVADCYFASIGNIFKPSLAGSTAALRFVNSRQNLIAGNHFVDIRNDLSSPQPLKLHAIYLAHYSGENLITRNRFKSVYGIPVKVRDASNFNEILDNRFFETGRTTGTNGFAFADSYCQCPPGESAPCAACSKATAECPSWNNRVSASYLDGTSDCATLATAIVKQPDSDYAGCVPPSTTSKRVRTSQNIRIAPPSCQ